MTHHDQPGGRTGPLMLRMLAVLDRHGPLPRADLIANVTPRANKPSAYRALSLLRERGLVEDPRMLPPAAVSVTEAGRAVLRAAREEARTCGTC